VAADAIGRRQQLRRSRDIDRRQQRQHGRQVLLVASNQVALELAVRIACEDVERGGAQEAQLRRHAEGGQHPGPNARFFGRPSASLAPPGIGGARWKENLKSPSNWSRSCCSNLPSVKSRHTSYSSLQASSLGAPCPASLGRGSQQQAANR